MNPPASRPARATRLRHALWLLIAATLPGAADAASAAPIAGEGTPLELKPCELFLPGAGLTAPAECGWLRVAENPAEPEGRQIDLRVARVPAQGREVEPDPLLLFAGGPGQAASEAWLILAPGLRKLNEHRDVLLIDQRGTGQSHALRCPRMGLQETLMLGWDQLERITRECLAGLDGDPRFYTTTIAMQDYDRVRAALGYEQVNLYGISYGTRAAQVYLRLFPERVRSVVLDGVVPQSLALGTEHAARLDQALHKVLERCEADAACQATFPETGQGLAELARQLDEQPQQVAVEHPLTGEILDLRFDRDALAVAVRFLTYLAETQALLPLLIHEAATTGSYQRLASQLLITASSMSESIAQGMELSVVCAEDFPLFPPSGAPSGESLLGDSMLEAARIQCSVWPRGEVPAGFHEPVQSEKPTLLLSGEFDPVTPPEYAEQVRTHFGNSLHVVAPGQGHGVAGKGCIGRLVSEFVAAADPGVLDTACIAQLQPSPWFMSLTGPQP